MNSLKWINGQIEIYNRKIKIINNELNHTGVTDPLKPDLTPDEIQVALTYTTQVLQILEQIKDKLEAWEELQKYLVLDEEYSPFSNLTYKFLFLKNACIDESNSCEEEKSLTIIKKALEVK